MSGLGIAWSVSVVVFGWLLMVGVIRLLAYRSGQVDHDPGMRFVAVLALGLAAVAAATMLVLTILIVRD